MKKELIGIKDPNGYWSFVFFVNLTENKKILDVGDFESIVKSHYPDIFYSEFFVEDENIYTLIENHIQFNHVSEDKYLIQQEK